MKAKPIRSPFRYPTSSWRLGASSHTRYAERETTFRRTNTQIATEPREVLDRLAYEFNIKEVLSSLLCVTSSHLWKHSDWYRVSRRMIETRGGERLFNYFESLGAALQSVFPHVQWDVEKFPENRRKRSWATINLHREFLDQIAPKLGVNQVYFLLIPAQILEFIA